MAKRTTEARVKGIIRVDPNIPVAPFIRTATARVDWLASEDEDSELTDALLEEIETWLAAHYYAHRDQLYKQKQTGKSLGIFQGTTGMGLESTQYGQTAMELDVTGRLSNQQVGAVWLGTED